jgi:hypothetical protein
MARPERLRPWRALFGVATFLCLAWTGQGVHASALSIPEAREVVSPSMPMASDRMPCALCYTAPDPVPHSLSGKCAEPPPKEWWAIAQNHARMVRQMRVGSRRRHLPIRIAYCRWLD